MSVQGGALKDDHTARVRRFQVDLDYHVARRRSSLLGAVSACARRGQSEAHRRRGRDPAQPRASRGAPSLFREGRAYATGRPHAERAPGARRVDPVADPRVGGQSRRGDTRAVRGDRRKHLSSTRSPTSSACSPPTRDTSSFVREPPSATRPVLRSGFSPERNTGQRRRPTGRRQS